ncbi:(deoxy)nucleoside triphosphate pyrophosphohydrolase [Jeotgalibaca ciconiae]|uniref:8-oxo-dGTP diphosphatase n=1 Tax=Jeotgalibaca ciconiae TaxID=2496265 RepID=A0A3Q9BJP1_9LACT|nr:(deoxy)nucleoside triphosphate pyrophosphohydrolase [Jeotgalibaca ciconiae]AZP03920.1 (deoxy)nucleoside triphosphate pyrophosphohydrolase [Jeotgalibaca ciconiae]HJB22823.1 (deoxy)nucleoside triphosphate pyrophosphohydrolase [Candidatus Jeotgalibaca pullicola]
MKKDIHVVGAVIESDKKVLCAQRGPGRSLEYLWEFPGGKIDPGETDKQALEREIREELLCEIEVKDKITTTRYEYDFGIVHLTTFQCDLITGTPRLTEHVDVKWLSMSELDTLKWAPADIPTIEILAKRK